MNERLVPRRAPRDEPAAVVAAPLVEPPSTSGIAAQLRRLADRVDDGSLGQIVGAAVVLERPYAEVPLIGGFGAAENAMHCYGLLQLGAQRLGAALLTGTVRNEV